MDKIKKLFQNTFGGSPVAADPQEAERQRIMEEGIKNYPKFESPAITAIKKGLSGFSGPATKLQTGANAMSTTSGVPVTDTSALLSTIKPASTTPMPQPEGKNMVNIPAGFGNGTSASNQNTPIVNAPTTGQPTTPLGGYDKALSDYNKTLDLTPEQVATQKAYNEAEAGFNQRAGAVEGQGRGIWTGAVSGQQGQINRMKALSLMPLTQKLALLQQQQQAKQNMAKTNLEAEQFKQQMDLNYAKEGLINPKSSSTGSQTQLTPAQKQAREEATQLEAALGGLENLVNDPESGFSGAVGFGVQKYLPFVGNQENPFIAGSKEADFYSKMNQLKNIMALPGLSLLKGATSDKDIIFLKNIGTSLSESMSEEAFKKELPNIRSALNRIKAKYGAEISSGGTNQVGQSSTGGFNF